MLLFAFFGGLMAKLADYTWGRALLLTYPEIFSFGLVSRKGPSKAQLETCGFQMLFIAHGFSSSNTPPPHPTPLSSLPRMYARTLKESISVVSKSNGKKRHNS